MLSQRGKVVLCSYRASCNCKFSDITVSKASPAKGIKNHRSLNCASDSNSKSLTGGLWKANFLGVMPTWLEQVRWALGPLGLWEAEPEGPSGKMTQVD